MTMDELLAHLHEQLGAALLKRIDSGEASASELNVARQFLKDNGIDGLPQPDNPLGQLAAQLPVFDDDTDANDLPLLQ